MRIVLLTLALLLASPAPAADDAALEEIIALARGGAQGLALRLLDDYQRTPGLERAAWAAAERERALILASRGEWRALASRFASLDPSLPTPFLDWAAERRAEASLHAGDGAAARAALRPLVWRGDAEPGAFRAWRALIIRSYLVDNDLDAALIALQRYALDHGGDDPAFRAQQRLAMQAGELR